MTRASNPIITALPACLNGDFYRDTFFDGGIPHPTWALFPAGPALDGLSMYDPTANLNDYILPAQLFAGGDIGYDRTFWRSVNWLLDADRIVSTHVPMLMWVGWNEPGTLGAQWLYAAVQNASIGRPSYLPMAATQKIDPKYQLIIGDWGHGGGLDSGIELEWFDTWIRGAHTGLDTASQPVHMKEMPSAATPRWINTRTFPHTLKYTPYYLAPGGALSPTVPVTGASETLPWGPGVSTSYTVAKPVTMDMTLIGPSALRVWASSSNTNMQLFAQLLDVAADGTSTEITHGSILGSRLLTDPHQSWNATNGLPAQPHLVLDGDRFLTPNRVTRFDIALQPPAWRLLKGHSLQLKISTQVDPTTCAAVNTLIGKPAGCLYTKPMAQSLPGGVYTILHDPAHRSVVNVPLVPSSSLVTARAGVTPTSGGVVLPQDWG